MNTLDLTRARCALALLTALGVGTLLLGGGACSSSTSAHSRQDGGHGDGAASDGEPSEDATAPDADASDAPPDVPAVPTDALPPKGTFCSLPGSYVWTSGHPGPEVVPGAKTAPPDLTWLTLPPGFCAHYFGDVANARQIRIAPDGDAFVASPTTQTTGGGPNGIAGIALLPDDDKDGTADSNITFLANLPSVQGLMFNGGYFYFQDDINIRRVPFKSGDRTPSAPPEIVTVMNMKQASEHWPKVFDTARDGTIYITNGASQFDSCECLTPSYGGVYKLNPDRSTSLVTNGFRNPIALRCETNHDVCLAAELALDYSSNQGGREKIVPVRQGDNWGYPCCATRGLPYAGKLCADTRAVPDCSNVVQESASFFIGNTPFGLDFENGRWPAPWGGRVFVTLHGDAARWTGARVVAIALDPKTGLPQPATDLDGGDSSNMLDFATGWDDCGGDGGGCKDHGRPSPITFAPDGRLFLGDDNLGVILWIAPVDLMQP